MKKKYTSVQMHSDTHKMLKEYAQENRTSISQLIETMSRKLIKSDKQKVDPNKVLKTSPFMVRTRFL